MTVGLQSIRYATCALRAAARNAAATAQRAPRCKRAGATTIETAIVLSLFLMLCFVILNLGLSTFRYNVLGAAARRVARESIVHGAAASPEREVWGPMSFSGHAADDHTIAEVVAAILPTMNPADVDVEVSWPDGENQEGDRVRVRLSFVDAPFVPFMSLGAPLTLKADCTMRIVH
jgi:TadE-like protein